MMIAYIMVSWYKIMIAYNYDVLVWNGDSQYDILIGYDDSLYDVPIIMTWWYIMSYYDMVIYDVLIWRDDIWCQNMM